MNVSCVDSFCFNGKCAISPSPFLCTCAYRWDPAFNCSKNFYEEWAGVDSFHYIIGYIIGSFVFCVSLLEIILDVRKGTTATMKESFPPKILLFISVILNFIHYADWQYYHDFGMININQSIILFDAVAYAMSLTVITALYFLVLVLWIGLSKQISTDVKGDWLRRLKHLKLARRVSYIAIALEVPGACISAALYLSAIVPILEFFFAVYLVFFILVGILWSLPNIFMLHKSLSIVESTKSSELKRRNNIFAVLNILLLVYLTFAILWTILGLANYPWTYLAFSVVLRNLEWAALILMFFFIERSFSFGPTVWMSILRQGHEGLPKQVSSVSLTSKITPKLVQ